MRHRRPSPKLHKLMANHYRPLDRMAQPPSEPPSTEVVTLEQLLDALGSPSEKENARADGNPQRAKKDECDAPSYDRGSGGAS